jgi:Tfp pilus assembly protein PilE
MQDEGMASVASPRDTIRISRLRAFRDEAGFTLIEVVLAGLMLAILSVPISALLSSTSAIARLDRERTGADQLAQARIETLRTLPYTQVGITGGNPPGVLTASTASTLPSGEAVTIATQVSWVADPDPAVAYPTNADYKKVVLTITRSSDGKQLSQKTTFLSSASAPPSAGSLWVQVKRQVIDAVTNLPLPGATVNLTGGPSSENRTDTTDASGTVLFPALDNSTNGTPVYTLATLLGGYNVFPDDLSPGAASSISSAASVNSVGTLRLYKPTTLTVNLQSSSGAAYTAGATISVDSSRCGVSTATVGATGSVPITSCSYATGKSVLLPPNVTGQVPADDKYFVTAWSNSGGFWVATSAAGVLVPSAYPNTLTQSVTLKFPVTTYSTTRTINVTVTKSGANDPNARVELTGGAPGVYLYGTTNSSGVASFTVPVTSTGFTFKATANDMGAASGTATTASLTNSPTTAVALPVTIS